MSTVDLQCSFTLVEGEGRGEVVVWEFSSLQLCTGPGLLGLSVHLWQFVVADYRPLFNLSTDVCLVSVLLQMQQMEIKNVSTFIAPSPPFSISPPLLELSQSLSS